MRVPDRARAEALLDELCARPPVGEPRTVDRPLLLYGAGNLGRMARAYFATLGIPLLGVVDVAAARHRADPVWRGVALFAPDEVSPEQRATSLLAVCIATHPYAPLAERLCAEGWADCVPFYDITEAYRDRHPLGNGWFATDLTERDRVGMRRVLTRWADDRSRAHHLQFIAWHRRREEWVFDDAPVTVDDRYFIPEVCERLGPGERLVDLGAHHGEVCERLLALLGGKVERIDAVEPDPDHLVRLDVWRAALPTALRARVRLIDAVLGAHPGPTRFRAGLGYASQRAPGGAAREQTTLDRLGLAPSLLKLHLEGAELEVLEGGLETLRRHRPIIAATCYHNALGLWRMTDWLATRLDDYRLLFRLHAWCGTGAVIYALPRERDVAKQDRSTP
ncbi:FkbM family methyltransferase [Marichromatium gracile]|uniref:FkbM family methyltransferase n=1 Tax=Marichromatium gracile TaxID=1048 RepID=A0A4R4AB76_MARGR|nr:FkbM family methyltransferase [Marichromatium gracile]MBK1709321.1 hypothetical protein [Marichromatium gracile]TCW36223.1 FkbM family methyltransferase [Marichromatium gracile]